MNYSFDRVVIVPIAVMEAVEEILADHSKLTDEQGKELRALIRMAAFTLGMKMPLRDTKQNTHKEQV